MTTLSLFRAPMRGVRLPFVFVLALVCVACDKAPPPAVAPSIPRITDRVEAAGGDEVEVAAHYPAMRAELAPLESAMRAYTQQQRAELAARIGKRKPDAGRAAHPGKLDLDFTLATQTVAFVGAIAQGQADPGDGAPPTPLRAAFNQHLPSGKVIGLSELFVDPDAALKIFSDEARRRLDAEFQVRLRAQNLPEKEFATRLKAMRERLETGTEPVADRFAAFLVDGVDGKAIGITLIFPPGQVAAEADGAQQVEVPVKLFADAIKPEYREAFDRNNAAEGAPPPGSVR